MSKPRVLAAFLFGARVGEVRQLASGRLAFRYDDAWVERGPGIPLSLSLPLARRSHEHAAVSAYLWGLLPDSHDLRAAIARDAGGSSRNPLALLEVMGEDCPGAVQFVPPERVGSLQGEGGIEWLDAAGVADALRRAKRGLTPRGGGGVRGRYSLAGAQPKTALYRADGAEGVRWGIPTGRTPTTHILKPPIPGLGGQIENEHFCLRLAAAAGLSASRTEVWAFEDERAIVVERYDRVPRPGGGYARVHQEDMCQALAVPPDRKYQQDGGPGIEAVVRDVLRASAADPAQVEADITAFLRSVVLNWIVLGTDAHAKNVSILHGRQGAFRLAPFYDIISALPYDDPRGAKMSLKVGGQYGFDVQPRHWERLAVACRVGPDALLADVRDLIARLPDLASDVARRCRENGLDVPVIGTLTDGIAARCSGLARTYGTEARQDGASSLDS